MTISGDYPTPVTVNGFQCRNCADVANAKKHIDPQHPRSGPYDVNAKDDPTQPAAVRFGGALNGLNNAPRPSQTGTSSAATPSSSTTASTTPAATSTPGATLDLVA